MRREGRWRGLGRWLRVRLGVGLGLGVVLLGRVLGLVVRHLEVVVVVLKRKNRICAASGAVRSV